MHEKVTELMAKMEDVKQIKSTLLSWLKDEVNLGKDCCHLQSAGDVTDMVKDLATTEKECAEALYYIIVISAMLDGSDEVRGYNHRHLSNGEFASAGRGHVVSGYNRPYLDQEPYIDAYLHNPKDFEDQMRHHGPMGYDDMRSSQNGDMYEKYKRAKRNYHDSRSMKDKEEMDTHHMMYMQDTLKNMKEMWDDADPMLKKKMKDDFGDDIATLLEKM